MKATSRSDQRTEWIRRHWDGEFKLEPASADASFRSYWRVQGSGMTRILMDAPPPQEDSTPFVAVAQRLQRAGLHAPEIFVADLEQGFLLLEDLGSRLYSDAVSHEDGSVEQLYHQALAALARMQGIEPAGLPPYDHDLLEQELELFPQWLLQRHLRRPLETPEMGQWMLLKGELINNAQSQPQVFVHRDYHCRNLMVVGKNNPGIVDFQDAVQGPVTYDLVSLLRDCYVRWEPDKVDAWSERFRRRQQPEVSPDQWRRWFDLMGFQRHLKAAGIFCRLNYRDGKAGYLKDIPRTLSYTRDVCRRYPEFAWFLQLLDEIMPSLALAEASA